MINPFTKTDPKPSNPFTNTDPATQNPFSGNAQNPKDVMDRARGVHNASIGLGVPVNQIESVYDSLIQATPLGVEDPTEMPPSRSYEVKPTLSGQVVGGSLELIKALSQLPPTLFRLMSNSVVTVMPAVGKSPAVLDIPGVTRTMGEPQNNPAYKSLQAVSKAVSAGVDLLIESHPDWQADPPDSVKDIFQNPSKFVNSLARAVPLLAGAGFSMASGSPSTAVLIMFASEKTAAKEDFLSRDVPEELAEQGSNVYGAVAAALEFIQVKQGLKLFGGMRKSILHRAATKLAAAKSITATLAKTAVLESVEEMGQGTWQEIVGSALGLEVQGGVGGFIDRRAQEAMFATALTLATGGLGKGIEVTSSQISKFTEALESRKADITEAINNGDIQTADNLMNEALQESIAKPPEAATIPVLIKEDRAALKTTIFPAKTPVAQATPEAVPGGTSVASARRNVEGSADETWQDITGGIHGDGKGKPPWELTKEEYRNRIDLLPPKKEGTIRVYSSTGASEEVLRKEGVRTGKELGTTIENAPVVFGSNAMQFAFRGDNVVVFDVPIEDTTTSGREIRTNRSVRPDEIVGFFSKGQPEVAHHFIDTGKGSMYLEEGANSRHSWYVEKALAEGKTVPPEVLAEYPDLAAQATPEAGAKPVIRSEDLPIAGDIVDGRTVRSEVPNTESISASLGSEYEELSGIREVPLSVFDLSGKHYSAEGTQRINRLAEEIKQSGEINPLIVVEDKDGFYILEGATRAEALYKLGAKSLPAVVIQDTSAETGITPEAGVKQPWDMNKEEFKANPPSGYVYKETDEYIARRIPDKVTEITDKFFEHDVANRKRLLAHEFGHDLMRGDDFNTVWEDVLEPFRIKDIPLGANSKFEDYFGGGLAKNPEEVISNGYAAIMEGQISGWEKGGKVDNLLRRIVETAQKRGLPIPPEVLAEYPVPQATPEAGVVSVTPPAEPPVVTPEAVPPGEDPIQQISKALKEARKVRPLTEAAQKAARKQRVAAAASTMERNIAKGDSAEESIFRATGLLKGPLANYNQVFEPIRDSINAVNPDAIDQAFRSIADNPDMQYFTKLDTSSAFRKLIDGQSLTYREADLLEGHFGLEIGMDAKERIGITPLADRLVDLWRAMMLTGIKTSGLNTYSNFFHGLTETGKDIPGVAVDSAISLFTGKRTLGLTVKGVPSGMVEGAVKGWKYLRTGVDERNIAEKLDYSKSNWGSSPYAKGVMAVEEFIFHLMGAEDQPFYYGAKARSLSSQAIAQAINQKLKGSERVAFVQNAIENPTDEMIKYAALDAEVAVFQQKTGIGDWAKLIQQGRIAGVPVGKVVVPFSRTPGAVATQIINYTPVGTIGEIFTQAQKGEFDQRKFSQAVGRSAFGVGVFAIGAALYKAGRIALDRPKSERERELWDAEGRKPNSILINEKWRSLNVLGPAGSVLGIGGHSQRNFDKTGSPTQAMVAAASGGAKSFSEQTFVTGANRVMEAISDPERGFETYFTSLAGSMVPTLIADIARATDTTERRSQSAVERIKSRIPGARETLEPRINAYGQDLPRYGGNTLEIMIDPTRPSVVRQDIVVDEMRRLWDAGVKVAPTLLGDRDGFSSLTPQENTVMWRRAGDLLHTSLFGIITHKAGDKLDGTVVKEEYGPLSDDMKGTIIEKFVTSAQNHARAEAALHKLSQGIALEELEKSGLVTTPVKEVMATLGATK